MFNVVFIFQYISPIRVRYVTCPYSCMYIFVGRRQWEKNKEIDDLQYVCSSGVLDEITTDKTTEL